MKTYLVGGAVRDNLLGIPVKDRDWLVVGSSVEDMLALDFQQVGKDFPVFLHPQSKEEYALARTERGLRSKKDISPISSPALIWPTCDSALSPAYNAVSPAITKYSASPTSPISAITSPLLKVTSSV